MSRVIIFSRKYPAYHPRKGESTYFVEQLQNSLCSMNLPIYGGEENCPLWFLESLTQLNVGYKHHTVRAGHRFKEGDFFSPRVWSGEPYKTKQIIFSPDIRIKKVWDFWCRDGVYSLNGWVMDGEIESHHELLEELAKNDGLTKTDFVNWFHGFKKPFTGQVICWNEKIDY